ncbi:MAG: hypothetical protein M0017_05335 [Desulfobacteraceae bacterium]|nr:hypothetical protein [Desulfobacteraceae bacterium]
MYLSRRTLNGRLHYFISRSVKDGRWWRSEDLLHLGTDPARYIVLTGRDSFYIDERIEKKLKEAGVETGRGEPEQLFLPFLPKGVREAYEQIHFRNHYRGRTRLSYYEEKRLEEQISLFDRRRLYFLKTGRLDLSRVGTLPIRYFKQLADKSRDELEQFFLTEEAQLDPGEYKQYVFAILNLQSCFARREARNMPQYLDQERLERVFLDELCYVNGSDWFRMGRERIWFLDPYLTRYVIMFFDYGWARESFWEEYIRRFMDSHRQYRPPSPASRLSEEEAGELFGMGREELRQLSRKQLVGLYRKRAKELHPDKGGDHDKFIHLTHAYESLLREQRPKKGSRG